MRKLSKLGRAAFLVLLITGITVAFAKLNSQDVPFADVAMTGFGALGGLLLLFAALLFLGKLLGRLTSGHE